jgi:tRNA(Ile)-lysidine synthase
MSFSVAQLKQQLALLPDSDRYWIAFSGGSDSHVLLHAMAQLQFHDPLKAPQNAQLQDQAEFSNKEVRAVHINHGLNLKANEWSLHCAQICQELKIPLHSITVEAQAINGESPEAAARHARYKAFAETISAGDVLLLAQHQDDQAETLLLQLFRGSGPQGLAAMPKSREFSSGWLCRPLLEFSRAQLLTYAKANQLKWIDDPSNFDTDYDRNYLRSEIIPSLKKRWPALDLTLGRAAKHQAEVMQLTQQLAVWDWQHCQLDDPAQLRIAPLQTLNTAEQTNLLRYWIKDINCLQVPDQQRLLRILNELIIAAADAQPMIEWGNIQLRRYQGNLYLVKKADLNLVTQQGAKWDLSTPVILTSSKQLVTKVSQGSGLKTNLQGETVQIRFRLGGETCRPVGRGHQMSLKNLMQEWSIPPWQRSLIPLIYINNEIAAVAGYCVCESYAAAKNEDGLKIMIKTIT